MKEIMFVALQTPTTVKMIRPELKCLVSMALFTFGFSIIGIEHFRKLEKGKIFDNWVLAGLVPTTFCFTLRRDI